MIVLAFVEYFPPVLGHDLRIHELLRRLSIQHDVHIVVLPSLRSLLGLVDAGGTRSPTDTSIRVWNIALPRTLRSVWQASLVLAYLVSLPILILQTIRIAKAVVPDVIVANYPSPYTGLVALFVASFMARPYVVDFSDNIASYVSVLLRIRPESFLARAAVTFQNFLIRKSAVLPTVTSVLRDYAVQTGVDPSRVHVIPNGVDLTLFSEAPIVDGRRETLARPIACFYGGTLERWAGLDLLLELARSAEHRGLPLEIALAGSAEKPLLDPLPGNVQLLGMLSRGELAERIRACDYVLIPFARSPGTHAASPVKLFEGLAAGKPCVCSDTGGIRDVVEDDVSAILVPSLDPELWLSAILDLEGDPERRASISRKAREVAEEFDWSRLAEEFEKSLIEAVRSHSSHPLRDRASGAARSLGRRRG